MEQNTYFLPKYESFALPPTPHWARLNTRAPVCALCSAIIGVDRVPFHPHLQSGEKICIRVVLGAPQCKNLRTRHRILRWICCVDFAYNANYTQKGCFAYSLRSPISSYELLCFCLLRHPSMFDLIYGKNCNKRSIFPQPHIMVVALARVGTLP